MKECTICNKLKALEDFTKSKAAKDGRRNQCKDCVNAQKRVAYEKANREVVKQKEIDKQLEQMITINNTHKVCHTCGVEKHKDEFTKDKTKIDGLYPSCKECKNSKAKQIRLASIEKHRARDREYMANNKEAKALADAKYRAANKESIKLKKQEYYNENREKLLKNNRKRTANRTSKQIEFDRARSRKKYLNESKEQKQRRAQYGKEYHKTTSGKLSSIRNANKRRALKLSQDDVTVTSQALEELKESQDHKCYYCKTPLEYNKTRAVHLDHYIPLSEGGMHSISNVIWSCGSCNWSKGNTIPTQPLKIPSK